MVIWLLIMLITSWVSFRKVKGRLHPSSVRPYLETCFHLENNHEQANNQESCVENSFKLLVLSAAFQRSRFYNRISLTSCAFCVDSILSVQHLWNQHSKNQGLFMESIYKKWHLVHSKSSTTIARILIIRVWVAWKLQYMGNGPGIWGQFNLWEKRHTEE